MCGWTGKPRSAATPSLATILRTPAGVNGASRSDVKMNGESGSCSRLSRRRARSSRPDNGDQHHGGIAVAVAILPASIDQAGNLAVGEVLAGADLGVTFAAWAGGGDWTL